MAEYIFKISKDVKIEKGSGWMNKADARKKIISFLFRSCNRLINSEIGEFQCAISDIQKGLLHLMRNNDTGHFYCFLIKTSTTETLIKSLAGETAGDGNLMYMNPFLHW